MRHRFLYNPCKFGLKALLLYFLLILWWSTYWIPCWVLLLAGKFCFLHYLFNRWVDCIIYIALHKGLWKRTLCLLKRRYNTVLVCCLWGSLEFCMYYLITRIHSIELSWLPKNIIILHFGKNYGLKNLGLSAVVLYVLPFVGQKNHLLRKYDWIILPNGLG